MTKRRRRLRAFTKIVGARTKPVGVVKPLLPEPPQVEARTKRVEVEDGDECQRS